MSKLKNPKIIGKCACGCGKDLIKKYSYNPTFIPGHNIKGKNNPNYGKKLSEKHRKNLSKAKKGKTWEEIYGKEGVKKLIEKRRKTYKNNPKIMVNAMKKRKQTYKDNPKLMKNREKKRLQTEKDNPEINIKRFKTLRQTIRNNPKITIEKVKKFKQTLNDNIEIMKNVVKKRIKTYENNPRILKVAKEKRKQTHKNNPKIRIIANKKLSATQQGINIKDWKKFVSKEPYSQNWTPQFRRAIRKRDNYICLKCGKHQKKQKRTLSVHHINYDKQFTCKENCCTLCVGCNSEVNKNRKQWTKFFQSLLSEKYGYEYGENQEVIINLEVKNE